MHYPTYFGKTSLHMPMRYAKIILKILLQSHPCENKYARLYLYSEGSQPLASWAEICSIFKLTKGAVERHYSRGVEEGSGGKNAILDEEWHQFRYGKLSYE